MKFLLISICTVVLSFGLCLSQDITRERLRLAQTYERAGDIRGAARLYQEMYELQPNNEVMFESVVRTLTALQQYQALRTLVEQRRSKFPSSELQSLAGKLAWLLNDTVVAKERWREAVNNASNKAQAWLSIAETQHSLGLTHDAIVSYVEYRKESGNSRSAAEALAGLYAAAGDVPAAITEILYVSNETSDVNRAKGTLSAIIAKGNYYQIIREKIEQIIDDNILKLRLLQWVYSEERNWSKALSTTQELDEVVGAQGYEVMMFADAARNNGDFDVALNSYSALMKKSGRNQYGLSATYGYARTLEQKLLTQNQISEQDAQQIFDRYKTIVEQHTNHPLAAEALYRMGVLKDDVLAKRDEARDIFSRLVNQFKGTTSAADGMLRLADIYAAEQNISEAQETLRKLVETTDPRLSDRRDLAKLRVADLLLYAGSIDSAKTMYLALQKQTHSAASNDALDRATMITLLADEDSSVVKSLVLGLQSQAAKQYKSAAELFLQAADGARDNDIQDRCLIYAVQNLQRVQSDSTVLHVLQRVLQRVPESLYGDRALYMFATIQQKLGNTSSAINVLTTLLTTYPRSILVPEVRERIRSLRGDS